MFNLFSFSKIICSLKINSLIGEWQGLTGRDKLLCSCSTVNTLEKNLPNSSALSLFELTVVELPEISTICTQTGFSDKTVYLKIQEITW